MIKHFREFWGLYFILIVLLLTIFHSKVQNYAESLNPTEPERHVQSKEIQPTSSNNDVTSIPNSPNLLFQDYDSTWIDPNIHTGSTPKGLSYTPRHDYSLDNYLSIYVGSHTDVVMKLIKLSNHKCIRYVYVSSGDQFLIKNIPQGQYYLKIAYGKDWRQKEIDGKIVGRFMKNALYEKGTDILNYNIQYTYKEETENSSIQHYQVPSYEIKLDVISSAPMNSFQTQNISEDEFNN